MSGIEDAKVFEIHAVEAAIAGQKAIKGNGYSPRRSFMISSVRRPVLEDAEVLVKGVVGHPTFGHHQPAAFFTHLEDLPFAQTHSNSQRIGNGDLALFGKQFS